MREEIDGMLEVITRHIDQTPKLKEDVTGAMIGVALALATMATAVFGPEEAPRAISAIINQALTKAAKIAKEEREGKYKRQ